MWLLVAVVVFETWCVEGLFRPLVVPGGSMAATLLGTHRKVVCEDCGFQFNRGVETHEIAARAVCPNCGHAGNDISNTADVSGDRVLMHKSVFFFRRPRAWEVVAFRDPAQANHIMVKRVVGLPGETISIRHGDVYANGKIRRKPLWLQRAVAVLVHDAAYSSSHRDSQNTRWITDRWAADGPDSQWGFADGKFAHPQSVANGKTQWLTYCHGRPGRSTAEGGCSTIVAQPPSAVVKKYIPSPVTDLCGYNQTRPRRVEDIHTVGDLMLSLRVLDFFGQGSMSIRANDARSEFLIRFTIERPAETNSIDPPRPSRSTAEGGCSTIVAQPPSAVVPPPGGLRRARIETWRDGQPFGDPRRQSVALPHGSTPDGFTLEVSLFDHRLLVAIDGQVVVDYPYEHEPTSAASPSNPLRDAQALSRPLALGRDGLGLIVEDVRVYRDIYYTHPYGTSPPGGVPNAENTVPVQLAADEYYVLGDNSPISSDSRNWPGRAAVAAKMLVGKPLAVHLPSRRVVVAGRQFQVPDIGRIRYIR